MSPMSNDGMSSLPALESRLPAPELREAALYERFAALGIGWSTHAHAPVFTVEEARALRGALPGTHTKNLFLEDKRGRLWLVVAREELRIDLNALAKALGARAFPSAGRSAWWRPWAWRRARSRRLR